MMRNALKNFSSADYINGACLTLENGQRHFKSSEILLNSKLYGIAISHLILGAEEYIKAFILLSLSGDPEFINENEKKELFNNHKFKHKNIADFLASLTNKSVQKFEDELFDILIHEKQPDSKYSRDGFYINKVFGLLSLTDEQMKKIVTWLNKANEYKNNGFYLGLDEDWETPERFTKEDYNKALEIVQFLKDSIEPLFDYPLTDEQFMDYLNRTE